MLFLWVIDLFVILVLIMLRNKLEALNIPKWATFFFGLDVLTVAVSVTVTMIILGW